MSYKGQYERNKEKLLSDKSICVENRELFRKFFEYEEYKLKRINGLANLDERAYKTLVNYIHKLKNVNGWFKNKAWYNLTKNEIKEVYDALEDNKILNSKGEPFKDKKNYYNHIFRSKPFELAGKEKEAKEVMEFYNTSNEEEVRFTGEETVRKIVNVAIQSKQKLLCWLGFDIGENLHTLLKLQKKDFVKQMNKDTNEPEYIVNLPKEKLKRSRTPRSEITNFSETVEFLDFILKDLKDEDYIFDFQERQAQKFFARAVRIVDAKCFPKGQFVTFKDLRSSMACYLLDKGWTTDEINARLGHKPSSRVLDKYINFKALNRHEPKQKLYHSNIAKVQKELEENREREKLNSLRIQKMQKENEMLKEEVSTIRAELYKTIQIEKQKEHPTEFEKEIFKHPAVITAMLKVISEQKLGKKLMETYQK